MKNLILFCLLSFNTLVFARQVQWYEGVVVLANAEVHRGEVSVNELFDLILFKEHDTVNVYPAHKVKALYYFDAPENINRKFLSLKDTTQILAAFHFYEVVLHGEVSVLRKQKYEVAVGENSDKTDYNYFVKMDGIINPIVQFKRKVYPQLLKTSREKIISFVTQNGLNPNYAASAIQIIKFYNTEINNNNMFAVCNTMSLN